MASADDGVPHGAEEEQDEPDGEWSGRLRLAGAQDSVMRTLEIVGLDTVIPCYSTLHEALAV
ncbi:STAS domain-containing protein [Streptomyces sp. NPDC056580]|uniref:STAS domain-containing protein n=1 Tax=Streptomyces sp. NPDC056580 TaxID=3345872 RepID=UPI0036A760A2